MRTSPGTASAPAIGIGAANTGLYYNGSSGINFALGGAGKFAFTSSGYESMGSLSQYTVDNGALTPMLSANQGSATIGQNGVGSFSWRAASTRREPVWTVKHGA